MRISTGPFRIREFVMVSWRVFTLSRRIQFSEKADRQLGGDKFMKKAVRKQIAFRMLTFPEQFPRPDQLKWIKVTSIEAFEQSGHFLPPPSKVKVAFKYKRPMTSTYTLNLGDDQFNESNDL